ncbi:MAG: DUF2724 domain-containing protein [Rouxiella aceris]|uniref:phage filamentation protein Fil family protein n=1 Tax=Rouxiella aceris TaxID=2703884 RepID=UPI00283C8169|nr:phage filamentation protein Fil family protein [Rouxiella aceris]MDR3432080.1 DUF2724 domain-containing protein [Rouxiella aceris]
MAISIAPLLKQQSPSRHFGHGWIELPDGKRWNPTQKYSVAFTVIKPVQKKKFFQRLFS